MQTNLRASIEKKLRSAAELENNIALQAATLLHLRGNVVDFVNDWCWTYDPRSVETPLVPFKLWPRQVEYLHWVSERIQRNESGIVEKSRDVGVTWLNVALAVHMWLFRPGSSWTFGANKAQLVDTLANPDSIIEKCRILIRSLPKWMLPADFSPQHHMLSRRIINPDTGSTIIGEAGPNMGRGGRSTVFVVDEAAHVEQMESVHAAISANSDIRLFVSSVDGMGNWFARKRHSGDLPVFRFHWSDDPRKSSEWAEKKRREIGKITFAAEYDIDYGASVEGLLIQRSWIEASRRLRRLVPDLELRRAPAQAGLDVGAGRDKSVLCIRSGPLVEPLVQWSNPDTVHVAHDAIERAREMGARRLVYDSIGVGHAVGYILANKVDHSLTVIPCAVGEPASESMVWPDGKTSRQRFINRRAELWWLVREALFKTWEHVMFLEGEPGGVEHQLDDLLALPDDEELAAQLNTPRWRRVNDRQIKIESKNELRSRGIQSPDRADALCLTFFTDISHWTADDVILGEPLAAAQVRW